MATRKYTQRGDGLCPTRTSKPRHRFFDVWNSGDLDSLDEIIAEDYVDHDAYNPHAYEGLEGTKKTIAMYRAGFSDLEMTLDDEVAADDVVVARWHAEGTHDGEVMGQAPTGNTRAPTHGITLDPVRGRQGRRGLDPVGRAGPDAGHRAAPTGQEAAAHLTGEISAGRGVPRPACSSAASPASSGPLRRAPG